MINDNHEVEGDRAKDGRSSRIAIALIILAWVIQFLSFSLERFLRDPAGENWRTIASRATVTAVGTLISLGMLRVLQRCSRMSVLKRGLVALVLALGGAILHSAINSGIFLLVMGPGDPDNAVSVQSFISLVYLFGWVYLAVTVILLSWTYGEELFQARRKMTEIARHLDSLRQPDPTDEDEPHVWVKKGPQLIRIDVSRIDWVGAEGECVRFHCGQESYLERQSIRSAAEQLAPLGFERIHRSAVVNLKRIEAVARTRWGSLQVRLRDGRELRVSKSYQPALKKRLRGGFDSRQAG